MAKYNLDHHPFQKSTSMLKISIAKEEIKVDTLIIHNYGAKSPVSIAT